MKVGFVIGDVESTGLDYDTGHVPWEIAWVAGVHDFDSGTVTCFQPQQWMIHLTDEQIAAGSPEGMKIGGFHERYKRPPLEWNERMKAALIADCVKVAEVTGMMPQWGGANPAFDFNMIRAGGHFTYAQWNRNFNFRLLDIQGIAAGAGRTNMKGLNMVAQDYNVTQESAHEALDDTIVTARCYAAIYGAEITGLDVDPVRMALTPDPVVAKEFDPDEDW